MKISKIFAGMSAAAIVASMMAALPASAEGTEAKAAEFGLQAYVMGNATWNWKSVEAKADDSAKITGTYTWKDIAAQSKSDTDEAVGDAGIQFLYGGTLDKGYTVKADVTYKITTNDNQTKEGTGKIDTSTKGLKDDEGNSLDISTLSVSLWGWGSDWTVLDTAEATVEVEFTNIETVYTEPESYTLPQTVSNGAYGGDWGADGEVGYQYFASLPEGNDLKVNVKATLLDGYDYYLAGPADMNGWAKLYNEGSDTKKTWVTGLDLKSSFADADLEAHAQDVGTPVLQDDGFIILYPAGGTEQEFSFTLSADAVAALKENYEDNDSYGGFMFQVYGVDITEVTVSDATDAAAEKVSVEYNQEITPDTNFVISSTDFEETLTKADLKLHFSKENWNDWCPIVVKVTAGDAVKYYALTGQQVNWNISAEILSLDEDGDPYEVVILPQDKDKFIASKDYEEGVTIVPDYEIINTIAAGDDYTLSIPEIGTADDWSIQFICLAWSADGTITVEDPDGAAKLEDLTAPLEDGSAKEEPYVLKLVSADFTVGEVTPVEPSDEPTDGGDDGEGDDNKGDGDKKDDGKGNGNGNTTNPKTGAAALALGTLALAGAAVVVSKKKD